ncbi:DNA repair protein RecN [Chloroflexota bacterium]
MLLELKVSNFGIIEQIDWRPGQGLSVITGETGAGKSLVVEAVETILSGRVDGDVIRYGAEEAFLEAVFDITALRVHSNLYKLLAEHGLMGPDEGLLVVSGEIRRQGRSVFRVNGKAVARGLLNQIGNLLVDIHGQSDHLSLLNRDFQLDFIDAYARVTDLRGQFGTKAVRLTQTEEELRAIAEQEKERDRQEEYLRFQIEELHRADLKDGEEEALEKERIILGASEKLKEASYLAYCAIYGDDSSTSDTSALEKLSNAWRALQSITELDDTLKSQQVYLHETESGLTDIARDIRSYHDSIEYDPQRLQEIEARLELIRSLKRKYGQTVAEVVGYLAEAEKRLADISTSEEKRKQLEEERHCLKKEMGIMASQLSDKRGGAAKKMMAGVNNELAELNMSRVKFEVVITRRESEGGIPLADGKAYSFTKNGVDFIEFVASTNPGEPLKPLASIASTGEMSRFMLALKSALAGADNIPVLIFDEIDIGVGGRSGEIVGQKLWGLSGQRQVVCITHLPQIAVYADSHYLVNKKTEGSRTTSLIKTLQGDDLVRELAVMLSGPRNTEVALRNAGELLARAAAWKKK